MNQTVETYIRTFISHAQDNWMELLPMAELAISNWDAASTGVSPFFLTYSYYMEPLQLGEQLEVVQDPVSPVQIADSIVRKLQQATEWAQSAIAVAQQAQEESANRSCTEGPVFRIGNRVWLNLRNVRTNRPSKKLDWKHAKFTVVKVVGSHSYQLDTPPGIHNVFHSDLLRLAATDPLPSQSLDDSRPPAVVINGQEEYSVERILRDRFVRRGRGRQHQALVKWVGYAQPTWEPVSALADTAAWASYEALQERRG
jgi:hypothetical protein